VSALFATAPDLIGEFKQFLPDDSRDSILFNRLMIADRGYVNPNSAAGKKAAAAKETNRKKRGAATETKAAKVRLPSSHDVRDQLTGIALQDRPKA
jgi:histone deacetylase complex regulatory component SIN3